MEAGLENWIELREGDALKTLKDVDKGIDFYYWMGGMTCTCL